MSNSTSAIDHLHGQWLLAAFLYTLGLALGWEGLAVGGMGARAWLWLIPAVMVSIYALFNLWQHLQDNRSDADAPLLPTLGIGTALTVARGLCLAWLAGFLLLPRPSGGLGWAPAACYGTAVLADYFDGYLARARHQATLLGQRLDLDLDALGILLAPLLAVLYGQLPVWYLLVSAARYLFAWGTWRLKRLGRPVYNLTDSTRRRAMAGFQMGLTAAVLLPVWTPPVTTLVATLFMIPFLIGFLRDWFVVSGLLEPRSEPYLGIVRVGEQIFYSWLPLLLRLMLSIFLIGLILSEVSRDSSAEGSAVSPLFFSVLGLAGGCMLLGLFGRLSALILLIAVAVSVPAPSFNTLYAALVVAATLVFLCGTGRLSVWQPEEALLRYRAGS